MLCQNLCGLVCDKETPITLTLLRAAWQPLLLPVAPGIDNSTCSNKPRNFPKNIDFKSDLNTTTTRTACFHGLLQSEISFREVYSVMKARGPPRKKITATCQNCYFNLTADCFLP